MNQVFASAWVIARRDFVATVWSRTFLLFLLAPIIAIGFGVVIGEMTQQADVQARQPNVAVVMEPDDARAVSAAHARLAAAVGALHLPELVPVDPEPHAGQAERLLASPNRNISAVLGGPLSGPTLTGPQQATGEVGKALALVLDDARKAEALRGARIAPPPVALAIVATEKSAGRSTWSATSSPELARG